MTVPKLKKCCTKRGPFLIFYEEPFKNKLKSSSCCLSLANTQLDSIANLVKSCLKFFVHRDNSFIILPGLVAGEDEEVTSAYLGNFTLGENPYPEVNISDTGISTERANLSDNGEALLLVERKLISCLQEVIQEGFHFGS
jgi:hypothetical protein